MNETLLKFYNLEEDKNNIKMFLFNEYEWPVKKRYMDRSREFKTDLYLGIYVYHILFMFSCFSYIVFIVLKTS